VVGISQANRQLVISLNKLQDNVEKDDGTEGSVLLVLGFAKTVINIGVSMSAEKFFYIFSFQSFRFELVDLLGG